jgi:Flp pilus assembly protein TadD
MRTKIVAVAVEEKRFFFEKKNQKTFATSGSLCPEMAKPEGSKVFCCFFSKKKSFLPVLLLAACSARTPSQVSGDGPSLRTARAALVSGQAGTSLAIAEGVLSQEPNNVAALVQAGDAEVSMQDRMDAEHSYKRALALDPSNLRAQLGLAKMQLAIDPHTAETSFRAILAKNPRSALTLTDLGVSLDRQNRAAEAQAAYKQALALDPNLFSAHVDLALSLALNGQAALGEQMLRDAAQSADSTPRVRADLAVAQIAAGHGDQAAQTLRADLSSEDTKASLDGMAVLQPGGAKKATN